MKNPIVLLIGVVILAAVGIGAYAFFQNTSRPDSMMKNDEVVMESEDAMTKEEDSVMESDKMMGDQAAGSRYIEYSKAVLNGSSDRRRVLFFYASWCPICKPADASFRENESKIPQDVTLIRVNYNDPDTDQEEKDLARKYGIGYQHTFVQIDGDGGEVAKWNGGQTEELLANIK